jgi:hypothetical protein
MPHEEDIPATSGLGFLRLPQGGLTACHDRPINAWQFSCAKSKKSGHTIDIPSDRGAASWQFVLGGLSFLARQA